MTLTQTGAATFTVTETGYRGTYQVVSGTPSVVTVTTAVASTSDRTPISIDAIASGTGSITVADTFGQTVTVSVGVTLTPVTIQNVGVLQ